MLYLLGFIVLLLIIYGVFRIINSRNKAFSSKLSLREKKELEKMIEKKAKIEEEEKEEKEKAELEKKEKEVALKNEKEEEKQVLPVVEIKTIYPSKDIKEEISRFVTHIGNNNFEVQTSIRNGVQNFINLDLKVALEEFSLAVELNPQDTTGYYCRGLTKLQLGNFESAVSDFTDSINLRMKEPGAFYYRALAYYKLQDFDNAILNFKSYISAESSFAQAYFDLAICYKEKKRFEEAINSFSQAIEINPKFELAYFERGLLKHKVNDKDGGCADLKKALEMGYLQAGDFLSDLCGENKL